MYRHAKSISPNAAMLCVAFPEVICHVFVSLPALSSAQMVNNKSGNKQQKKDEKEKREKKLKKMPKEVRVSTGKVRGPCPKCKPEFKFDHSPSLC